MICVFFILSGLSLVVLVQSGVGPAIKPTRGEVWPFPEFERKESKMYVVTPSFRVEIAANHTCPLLERAVERYRKIYAHPLVPEGYEVPVERKFGDKTLDKIDSLQVILTKPCEDWPYLGMDEKYRLVVSKRSKLTSESVWGVLRGLETFAQLFYVADDCKTIQIRATEIRDYPHYPYRGIMLSTTEMFIPIEKILQTIAAMAINKLNVLHWHIVGDESWPYESKAFPDLSKEGSYNPTQVYTAEDISHIVEYARDRGIIVIPQISMPGGCRSIGNSRPEILTSCPDSDGPLNPVMNDTFDVIKGIYLELQERFHGFVYVGSPNLVLICWKENNIIRQYMKEHNVTAEDLLTRVYHSIFEEIQNNTTTVIFQDLWELKYPLPNKSIIHVYRSDGIHDAIGILKDNYRCIMSTDYKMAFGLKFLGGTDGEDAKTSLEFHTWYVDPLMLVRLELRAHRHRAHDFLGAEMITYTPALTDSNLINNIWPAAIGFAEAMWSIIWHPLMPPQRDTPLERAAEHTCRMRRRGLPVGPGINAGYCLA